MKQAMNKKSSTELKADLGAIRKAEESSPYPGYPTLGPTYVPAGQIQAVPTKDYLNHLAKNEFCMFKRFVRIYGSQQVVELLLQLRNVSIALGSPST